MTLTTDQLKKIVPAASKQRLDLLLPYLNTYMPAYDILNAWRVAAFVAETAVESGSYNRLEENLNYSAERLIDVFGHTLFPSLSLAKSYERQPEKIANYVYANKGGNSNVQSGDGFRFRGRGIIQTTLKDNYLRLSKGLFNNDTLLKNPDLIALPAYAVESACWYWKSHNLNELADRQDFKGITRKINPALIGYDDRLKFYNTAKKVLNLQ